MTEPERARYTRWLDATFPLAASDDMEESSDDRKLADAIHRAVRDLNAACDAATDKGLQVSLSGGFAQERPYRIDVRRHIPARSISYNETLPMDEAGDVSRETFPQPE